MVMRCGRVYATAAQLSRSPRRICVIAKCKAAAASAVRDHIAHMTGAAHQNIEPGPA